MQGPRMNDFQVASNSAYQSILPRDINLQIVFSIISPSPQSQLSSTRFPDWNRASPPELDSAIRKCGRTWGEGPHEQNVDSLPGLPLNSPDLARLEPAGVHFQSFWTTPPWRNRMTIMAFAPRLKGGNWAPEKIGSQSLNTPVEILVQYWINWIYWSIHFWISRNSGYLKIIVLFTVCHQSKET